MANKQIDWKLEWGDIISPDKLADALKAKTYEAVTIVTMRPQPR